MCVGFSALLNWYFWFSILINFRERRKTAITRCPISNLAFAETIFSLIFALIIHKTGQRPISFQCWRWWLDRPQSVWKELIQEAVRLSFHTLYLCNMTMATAQQLAERLMGIAPPMLEFLPANISSIRTTMKDMKVPHIHWIGIRYIIFIDLCATFGRTAMSSFFRTICQEWINENNDFKKYCVCKEQMVLNFSWIIFRSEHFPYSLCVSEWDVINDDILVPHILEDWDNRRYFNCV